MTSFIELEVDLKDAKGFKLEHVVGFTQKVDELIIELDTGVKVVVPDEKIDCLSWKAVDEDGETKVRSNDFITNRFTHKD